MTLSFFRRMLVWLACGMPVWLMAQEAPPDHVKQTYAYIKAYARYHNLLLQQVEPINRQLAASKALSLNTDGWVRLDMHARWVKLDRKRQAIDDVLPQAQRRDLRTLYEQGGSLLQTLSGLWAHEDTLAWRQGLEEVETHHAAIQTSFDKLRGYLLKQHHAPDTDWHLMTSFLTTAEVIQSALKEGAPDRIVRDYHALRALRKEIEGQKDTWLAAWPRYPGSRRDPAVDLQTWTRQADKWLGHLDDYLQGELLPSPFSDYPKSYGYLQYRLLPIYNGQGQGLVDSYVQLRKNVTGTEVLWPPAMPDFQVMASEKPKPLASGNPCHYVLILDVSASMGNGYKWRQVMGQLERWTIGLHPEDRLSILACGGEIETWEAGQSAAVIREKVQTWKTHPLEGGSNIAEALANARQLAEDPWVRTDQTKVLLITDGGFEIPFSALATLQRYRDAGARLFTTYTGRQEPRMREHLIRLAEMGGGSYWYLNTRGLFPLSHPDPSTGLTRN